jgi:hypothetical protein
MSCVAQGCTNTGQRKLTETLSAVLGLPPDVDGLVCHSCRQPGLAAHNASRKNAHPCAACDLPFKVVKARKLSARDADVLGIADADSKPQVCPKCYSKLQSELRKKRAAGLVATPQNRSSNDYKKENASLRKRCKAAESALKEVEGTLESAGIVDGRVMQQSKAQKVWDVNVSKTSSRRYSEFIVDQMEYMATAAAFKPHWGTLLPSQKQAVNIDQALKV